MGGGLLPITYNKGSLLLLLGRERYDKNWSDFGGSKEGNESYLKTALREGEEELNGILGTGKQLANLVDRNLLATINNHDSYTSVVFRLKYDSRLPHYFNNNNRFIESRLKTTIEDSYNSKSGLFEKDYIKWFTLDEIQRDYTRFRPHFVPILKSIVHCKDKFYNEFDKKSTRIDLINCRTRKRKI
tara:strand:- start:828 stop:1385 length:558 start_codon:yes stop_codon:yes gene_type:complete